MSLPGLIAALFVATNAIAAIAQPEIGSRIDRSTEGMTGFHDPMVQNSARAGVNAIARCKAENNRFRAANTLDYEYLSKEQADSFRYIFKKVEYDDTCYVNKHLQFGYSTAPVVGAFAEFFLLRNYGQEDIAKLDSLTDADWQNENFQPRTGEELFGLCVVRSGREKIYDLISTVPDTRQENEAIQSVVPLLGPCVTEGLEVSFDKTSLRAMLAYGLYRAVHQHAEMMEAAE